MEIITGFCNEPHITSQQDQVVNKGIFGEEGFVLQTGKQLKAEIQSNNEVRILDGVLVLQGCACAVQYGTYDSVAITNGSQGEKRVDLIVARYQKDAETQVESVQWAVIQGTPDTANPQAPGYTHGNIQAGDLIADMPVYEVHLNGVTLESVVPVYNKAMSLEGVVKALADKYTKNDIVDINGNGITITRDDAGVRLTMSDGTSFRFHANGQRAWIHRFDAKGTQTAHWDFLSNGDFQAASGDVLTDDNTSLKGLKKELNNKYTKNENVDINGNGVEITRDDAGVRLTMTDGTSFRLHANEGKAWIHKFDKDGEIIHAWYYDDKGNFTVDGDVITGKNASLNDLKTFMDTLTKGSLSNAYKQNLTASRALASNASGKIAVTAVTSTELARLSGVEANVQDQLDNKYTKNDIVDINGNGITITRDDAGVRLTMSDGTSFRFHANEQTAWIHHFDSGGKVVDTWTFKPDGGFSTSRGDITVPGASLSSLITQTGTISFNGGFTFRNVNRVAKSGNTVQLNAMAANKNKIESGTEIAFGSVPSGFRPVAETSLNGVTNHGIPYNASVFQDGQIILWPGAEMPEGEVVAINVCWTI